MKNQPTVTTYLNKDSKTLGNVLTKLKKLNQWNSWLNDCFLEQDKQVLQHCQIVGMDRAALLVVADTSHWMLRFRFFIPMLMKELKKYPDFVNLGAICCKVRPSYTPQRKIKNNNLKISAKNCELLKNQAQQIKDEKLRKIMERIAERG